LYNVTNFVVDLCIYY